MMAPENVRKIVEAFMADPYWAETVMSALPTGRGRSLAILGAVVNFCDVHFATAPSVDLLEVAFRIDRESLRRKRKA